MGVSLLGEFQVVLSAAELPPTPFVRVSHIYSTAWGPLSGPALAPGKTSSLGVTLKGEREPPIPDDAVPKRRGRGFNHQGMGEEWARSRPRRNALPKVSDTQVLLLAI